MSGVQITQRSFISLIGFDRLEDSLRNPEDRNLLYSLLPTDYLNPTAEECPDTFLLAIWDFTMTKIGASTPALRAWATGQMRMFGVPEDGVFAEIAFLTLSSLLSNQEDRTLLDDCFSEYNGCPGQALWAIWGFAVAKGKESAKKWRRDLDASRQTQRQQ